MCVQTWSARVSLLRDSAQADDLLVSIVAGESNYCGVYHVDATWSPPSLHASVLASDQTGTMPSNIGLGEQVVFYNRVMNESEKRKLPHVLRGKGCEARFRTFALDRIPASCVPRSSEYRQVRLKGICLYMRARRRYSAEGTWGIDAKSAGPHKKALVRPEPASHRLPP